MYLGTETVASSRLKFEPILGINDVENLANWFVERYIDRLYSRTVFWSSLENALKEISKMASGTHDERTAKNETHSEAHQVRAMRIA